MLHLVEVGELEWGVDSEKDNSSVFMIKLLILIQTLINIAKTQH